ncbi:MAG: hypothetical protein JWL69_1015 [Phycisphaerales bacterium]|nr:hypothetical protein [Phycisphaerales bacterium]MDB5356452.1 hypothetical protein [Phycisphaerales bacterium]
MTQSDEGTGIEQGAIVARAGSYYRNARYLLVTMMVGAGLWFAYDGWIGWAREKAHYDSLPSSEQSLQHKPHTDLDIALQKKLAFALVPIGPLLLAWFLYRSRGEYRLADGVLSVPGHPNVPLTSVRSIDKAKWDRKGIVRIEYDDPAGTGQTKWLVMDDFIYERGATDRIVEQVEAVLPATPEEEGAADVAVTDGEEQEAVAAEPEGEESGEA